MTDLPRTSSGRSVPALVTVLVLVLLLIVAGARQDTTTEALTPAGLVKDINPSGASTRFFMDRYIVVNDVAYFNGQDSAGVELWRSDGTTDGTYQLKDINPAGDSNPVWFATMGGIVYFRGQASSDDGQLWRTDGRRRMGHSPFPPTPRRTQEVPSTSRRWETSSSSR